MPRMTQAEYDAYQARFAVVDRQDAPPDACTVEKDLHQHIIEDCVRRGWLVFHGSMAHRTYRTPGEPDFIIMLDNAQWLVVECKTRTGKLSIHQQGMAMRALRLGHVIHVIRSKSEWKELTG